MKKWYRNNFTKAVLIGLAHIVSVVLIIAMLWILTCPSGVSNVFSGAADWDYCETEGFSEKLYVDSLDIIENYSRQKSLTVDGKVDLTKLVDLKEYYKKNHISNENENGIAYSIEELIKWAEAIEDGTCESSYNGDCLNDPIIVCQKEDGSYEYFYSSELDIDKRMRYVDCWDFDGNWMEEIYVPQGAESILDIVNTDPQWNGRLSEVFEMIYQVSVNIRDEVEFYEENKEKWNEGNTNISYLFADLETKEVYCNRKAYTDFEKLEESIKQLTESGQYLLVRPTLKEFETNMNGVDAETWYLTIKGYADTKEYLYLVAIDTEFPIPDEYAEERAVYMSYAPYIPTMTVLGILSALILIVCIVWLTVIAGRKPEDEEIHLHIWDKCKTEIAAVLVFGMWMGLAVMVSEIGSVNYYTNVYENVQMVFAGILACLTCAVFLIGYLSLVRRIKAKTLWKNSLMRSCIMMGKRLASYISKYVPELWKLVLMFGGLVILHWIAMAGQDFAVFLAVLTEIAAFIYILNMAIGRKKIKKGVDRISSGELEYKIELEHLHGQQLEIAEMINNIGDGLQAAVDKSMKSERLKTDLITNVSHDIKTPLTSIINYIDLLKRENFADAKVQGYLEVLESKAQRLKTLTEDVVEASKISSGNIMLEKMKINLVEMIQQTSGEFEEKFKNRGLVEVWNLPDTEAFIYVDGRRMWRVLENIYNNAAKYAMEGTRVYMDLKVVQNQVIFSIKNISEQPLNIDAEELTERFIRGDVSRNTEGSGLGLSIAKNLTEMQGGTFELYLDGDLFKVTIIFPKC